MNPLLFIHMNIIALLLAASALADQPNEEPTPRKIPLEQIWAYGMPGTKDVRELEQKLDVHDPSFKELYERSLLRQMVLSLGSRRLKEGETIGPAIVVSGTGKKALPNAHAAITKSIEHRVTFAPETDLTLVFYSVIGAPYVHIASVEKTEHVITVKYRFVSHNTRDDSFHFALIPLGQLPEGKYEIKIDQLESFNTKAWLRASLPKFERVVCHGTSFTVRKEKP